MGIVLLGGAAIAQDRSTDGAGEGLLVSAQPGVGQSLIEYRPCMCPICVQIRAAATEAPLPVHQPGNLGLV